MTAHAPLPDRLEALDPAELRMRAAPRAEQASVRAFSQVLECAARPELVRRTGLHEVVRTHAAYLELLGRSEMPRHTLLECWVDLPEAPRKVLIAGRVIHCRRDASGAWLVQLELADLPGTELADWRSRFY